MTRLRPPIGIQRFRRIRDKNATTSTGRHGSGCCLARAGALQWHRLPDEFELVGLTPWGAATAQLKNRSYTGR